MGVAAAVAGSALVGAYASSKASSKAVKASDRASQTAATETRRSTEEARADLNRLFPQAQQAGQQGFQGALDVFNQAVPQRQQAFQGGNVAAQQQILAGLPQIQNALMGNAVDYSGFKPYQAPQYDMSYLNQQLPYMQQQEANAQMNNGLGPFTPENPAFNGQMGPFQTANTGSLLGGKYNFRDFNFGPWNGGV